MKITLIILILIFLFCGVAECKYYEGVLSIENPIEVNMKIKDFQEEVLESNKLIIVDFWASWCRPCKAMSENLERIIEFNKKYNRNRLEVYKVNVDKNRKLMAKYLVRGLPTVIFFKGGKEVDRIVGLIPFLKIQDKINSLLKEEKKEKKEKKNDCGGTCPPPKEYR